jgi:hypothetical protein
MSRATAIRPLGSRSERKELHIEVRHRADLHLVALAELPIVKDATDERPS